MKVVAIAAEFDPFHNGHAHLIEEVRSPNGLGATHVVAIMSGHFVQRGEPALLPKAERVRMALAGGADVVVELPTPWALSSAEGFARGAVALAESLGCVEAMAFGSECGDLDKLTRATHIMSSPRFREALHFHLAGGISYAEAQQRALAECGGDSMAELLTGANNTLGLAYMREMSSLYPYTVKRVGAGHDEEIPVNGYASASLLRRMITAGRLSDAQRWMPAACRPILSAAAEAGWCPADPARAERALLYRLRQMSIEELAALPAISEGFENRLAHAAQQATDYSSLIDLIKTKRYPRTRVQRALWCAYVGITASDSVGKPPYLRVLGVNERGIDVVRAAKQAGELPVLTRAAQAESLTGQARRLWQLEARAADLYALTLPKPFACGREYTTGLVRAKDVDCT